jgi:thioredoxin 1
VAVLVAGSGLLCGCASFGAKDRVSRAVEVNSEAEFARVVLQARSPVIAIFHAPSCGTCHKVLKGLPDLADDYAGKVTFVTVDVAVCPKLGGDYGVRWVPVWVFLKDGQEQQRMSGWRPRFWTDGKIDDFLAGR